MPEQDNEVSDAQMIVNCAKFELQRMIGNNCIDYGKLLAILEGKFTS